MDIFKLTKSKTRQKILELFLAPPQKAYYVRELEKNLTISAGNIRRELLSLVKTGLIRTSRKGRLLYYKIDTESSLFEVIKSLLGDHFQDMDIKETGYLWTLSAKPKKLPSPVYCATRDVFSVRLESLLSKATETLGDDAYLLMAVAGEIGNNSFDHNLGNWPDMPGIFFAADFRKKIIVLADRGQGILKTISNSVPGVKDDSQALEIAFTKFVSGRFPEKRGNGLKFVAKIIREKTWKLRFASGTAELILKDNKMIIEKSEKAVRGCFAVIEY